MPYPEIYPPDEESYHPTAVTHTMFVDAIDRAAALPSCPTGSWASSMANQPGEWHPAGSWCRRWSAAGCRQPGQHHLAAARSPSVGAVPASALPALAVA
jgi:hypothetical protein